DALRDYKSALLLDGISQPRRDHVPILASLQRDIIKSLVKRDSKIRRQRPRSSRPDNREQLARLMRRRELRAIFLIGNKRCGIFQIRVERERDVDRWRHVLAIFDFRLS